MAPLHVWSKFCIAPIHVWSKFVDCALDTEGSNAYIAHHMERSNTDFAAHMELIHSFRVLKIAEIEISAKFVKEFLQNTNI